MKKQKIIILCASSHYEFNKIKGLLLAIIGILLLFNLPNSISAFIGIFLILHGIFLYYSHWIEHFINK